MIRERVIGCMLLALTGSGLAEPLDKVVAIVNNNVITESELAAQVAEAKQQLAQRKMALPSEVALKKQVLNHLIDEEIELQLAKNNDVTVDNLELDETIAKIAASNHLTVEQMREELLRQGISFKDYRNRLRKEMIISRIQQQAVGKDITISMQQIKEYLKSFDHLATAPQTYHVQNIVIPLSEEPSSQEIKKAELKAASLLSKIKQGQDFGELAVMESSGEYALEGGDLGERHLAELPEVFAKQVVKMKEGEVAGPIRTANGFQLIKLARINQAEMHHEVVKTHVQHILIKQDASMTEAEAMRQINNLYEQLKSGKDFAAMAQRYSLDRTSGVKGGDLGWVTPEELVPSFAEAMNALEPNVISKPVKSQFGWHLIQVLARKTEDDSETYQRLQVRKFLHQRKFTEAVQNWQQHMRSSAYVNILEKDLT